MGLGASLASPRWFPIRDSRWTGVQLQPSDGFPLSRE